MAYVLAALAQVLSGFGFSLTAIPLLTLVCSRKDAVVSSTLVGLASQSAMAWHLRREIERDAIRWALPASFVGMPLGIVVGHLVSERAMRVGVGVAVLVAVVSMVRGATLRGEPRVIDTAAGLVSGLLATTTGTNGPPLVVAFAGRNLAPGVTRATLSVMFALANVVSFALFAADHAVSARVPMLAAVGLVPTFAMRVLAEGTFRKLDQRRYRAVVLCLLTGAGIVAIVNALR